MIFSSFPFLNALHKIYGENINKIKIPERTAIDEIVFITSISLFVTSAIPGQVTGYKNSFNFLFAKLINVVLSKTFINMSICSLKPVMNKSVILLMVSSKSSSKSPPSFTSNKIYLNVSFNERAFIPVPFESIKSIIQSISKHSL